jgi:hypothetical protein
MEIGEMYHGVLEENENEVDRLTHEVGERTGIIEEHVDIPSRIKVQSREAP